MTIKYKTILIRFFQISVASFLYAVGVSCFLDSNKLAPGGITGVAILISSVTGIDTGILYFILNIPVLLLGFREFGWKFFLTTIYTVFLVSFFSILLEPFGYRTNDLLFAALMGGFFVAIGMGWIFRNGATTGGIDIIIKMLRQRFRHIKTGFWFFILDFVVIAAAGMIFGDWILSFYAVLCVLVCQKGIDRILYGGDEARMLLIITDYPEQIGEKLMREQNTGVTYLECKGGWSGTKKKMLLCIVSKRLAPIVEERIKKEDPDAFLIVTSASEIYGKGYKAFSEEVL